MATLTNLNDCVCDTECPALTEAGPIGPAGAAGSTGTNGTNGLNSYTTMTAAAVMPAVNANVTISVVASGWAVVGQNVYVQSVGYFEVISKPTVTSMTIKNLGGTGNVAPASVIPSGRAVDPAGQTGPAAPTPVAIASGGTGQITATLGFNALSPLTTKGDILGHDGTNNLRIPVGADGLVLVANSVDAEGINWAQVSLTAGVTGILPEANGGLNAATFALGRTNLFTGSAFVMVQMTATNATNGTNLIAAYAAAAALTPGGAALSATNRATVFLLPGTYTLTGGALVLATQFVDLVGLGDAKDIILTGTGITVTQTANDVVLDNFTINSTIATPANSTDGTAYYPTTALANTVCQYMRFTSANSKAAMRVGIDYAGTYENCSCITDDGFGGLAGIASGVFRDCENVGNQGFGGDGGTASGSFFNCRNIGNGGFAGNVLGAGGTASGLFFNCVNTSHGGFGGGTSAGVGTTGTFIGCLNQGERGFGGGASTCAGTLKECVNTSHAGFGGIIAGTGGTVSGVLDSCKNDGNQGFAGGTTGGTISGAITNCRNGGTAGFAGATTVTGGTISSTIQNCTNVGINGFAGGVTGGIISGTVKGCINQGADGFASGSTTLGSISGFLHDCVPTGRVFSTLTGEINNTKIKATGANEAAIWLGASARLYNCTLVATGTANSIEAVAPITASIAHCRTNLSIDANVTNDIATPYNVDDTSIA